MRARATNPREPRAPGGAREAPHSNSRRGGDQAGLRGASEPHPIPASPLGPATRRLRPPWRGPPAWPREGARSTSLVGALVATWRQGQSLGAAQWRRSQKVSMRQPQMCVPGPRPPERLPRRSSNRVQPGRVCGARHSVRSSRVSFFASDRGNRLGGPAPTLGQIGEQLHLGRSRHAWARPAMPPSLRLIV